MFSRTEFTALFPNEPVSQPISDSSGDLEEKSGGREDYVLIFKVRDWQTRS